MQNETEITMREIGRKIKELWGEKVSVFDDDMPWKHSFLQVILFGYRQNNNTLCYIFVCSVIELGSHSPLLTPQPLLFQLSLLPQTTPVGFCIIYTCVHRFKCSF